MSAAGYSAHLEAARLPSARVIDGLLFITVLVSPFVFIEPSPYEAMWAVLALACLFSGMKLNRKIVPLIVLLLLWNISGLVALLPVTHDSKAVIFMATSFYLAINAVIFAFLFNEHPESRMRILRAAYVLAAVIASIIGIAMYLGLLPTTDLLEADRIRSTFKDPNVYGPFLILPLMFLIDRFLREGFGLLNFIATMLIASTLFLSFSRGAWGHFFISMLIAVVLMFLTSRSGAFRMRIVGFAVISIIGLVVLLAVLLSIDSVGEMFRTRTSLLQDYDSAPGGRFGTQAKGLELILDSPLGVGPLQFAKLLGLDPHNTYINAFASYGWFGGCIYVAMVVATIGIGLRAVFVPSPWQRYLIVGLATYIGVALEGFIIDTDHWRHYYLLLGLVWGLSAASIRFRFRQMPAPAVRRTRAAPCSS